MFHTKMSSNGGRRILNCVRIRVGANAAAFNQHNLSTITQVTFKLVNKGLLFNNRRLDFPRFQVLFDLVTNKRGLDGHMTVMLLMISANGQWKVPFPQLVSS